MKAGVGSWPTDNSHIECLGDLWPGMNRFGRPPEAIRDVKGAGRTSDPVHRRRVRHRRPPRASLSARRWTINSGLLLLDMKTEAMDTLPAQQSNRLDESQRTRRGGCASTMLGPATQ
jgi:hypothetical protein